MSTPFAQQRPQQHLKNSILFAEELLASALEPLLQLLLPWLLLKQGQH